MIQVTKAMVMAAMGPVIAVLFDNRYPEGTTMAQLERDASERRWIGILYKELQRWNTTGTA